VERSIATTPLPPSGTEVSPWARYRARRDDVVAELSRALERVGPLRIGLALVIVALAVYMLSNPERRNTYNHFVWQAQALLEGRFSIAYPVRTGEHVNSYFQDVMPLTGQPGRGLLPFPPLPALALLPFVAVWGLSTDATLVAMVLGALNVGLCWRMTLRLTGDRAAGLLATIFFGFGTVHWYAAMLGSTWFLAHVVSITFLLLGITLALDAERAERARAALQRLRGAVGEVVAGPTSAQRGWFVPMQFMAGFVFGLAAIARLPVLLGAPFFVLVGGGASYRARALSAGLGAVIPFVLLLGYNLAASGHVFNPAYEWLYQTEYLGYMPPGLEINRDYAIEDPRHVPVNLLIMLLWPPIISPECGLPLIGAAECALIRPDPIGLSIVLTSPAYLLAVPLVLAGWRQRLILGATLAIAAIALLNLMHFSQGWVQFGYRFSNDFAPFAMILVTLAIAWLGVRPLTVGLVALSVVVNAWGVTMGIAQGW
jgi:hypothetical protein